jgi:hypothetical protein
VQAERADRQGTFAKYNTMSKAKRADDFHTACDSSTFIFGQGFKTTLFRFDVG